MLQKLSLYSDIYLAVVRLSEHTVACLGGNQQKYSEITMDIDVTMLRAERNIILSPQTLDKLISASGNPLGISRP